MPAPAVIPAPIAYINAAAVKKLVVGSRVQVVGCHAFLFGRVVRVVGMDKHSASKPALYQGGNGALRVNLRVESDSAYTMRSRGRPPMLL